MSSTLIVTLEVVLVLGVVIGVGVWQLVSVRREIARDRARAASADADAARADRRRDTAAR